MHDQEMLEQDAAKPAVKEQMSDETLRIMQACKSSLYSKLNNLGQKIIEHQESKEKGGRDKKDDQMDGLG